MYSLSPPAQLQGSDSEAIKKQLASYNDELQTKFTKLNQAQSRVLQISDDIEAQAQILAECKSTSLCQTQTQMKRSREIRNNICIKNLPQLQQS